MTSELQGPIVRPGGEGKTVEILDDQLTDKMLSEETGGRANRT